MVRIIMHGCNGHMGQVISQLVRDDKDAEIVAGIDIADTRDNGYPGIYRCGKVRCGCGCDH